MSILAVTFHNHPDRGLKYSNIVTLLKIKQLTVEQLPAIVELDRLCFGGHWTWDGYQQELNSPISDLLGLEQTIQKPATQIAQSPLDLWGEEKQTSLLNPLDSSEGLHSKSQINELIGLGCFWSILDEAHITLLAIHPAYQGKGLGQIMLTSLMKVAQKRKMERATLEVRASNQAAQSLYKKLGFKEAGRRRRYYQDTQEDALILWCPGLQTPEFTKTLENSYQSIGDRLSTLGWQLSIKHSKLGKDSS